MSSLSLQRSFESRNTTASGGGSRAAHTGSRLSASQSALSSAKSRADTASGTSAQEKKSPAEQNPFSLPQDVDFFLIRDQEKQRKQMEREINKNLKVHQKLTHTGRLNSRLAQLRNEIEDEEQTQESAVNVVAVQDKPSWKLAVTRDRQIQKESLHEYINKKREMFLLQYSLAVKRDEIHKLEAQALAEEMKLERAEQYLEEDAVQFDKFLKQNDQNSVDALKLAENETKLKMEKVSEIKKLTAQMMNIKSDISKCEEILHEYLMYKKFLFRLSPKEWRDTIQQKRGERMKSVVSFPKEEKSGSEVKGSLSPTPGKKPDSRMTGYSMQSRDSTRESRRLSRPSNKTLGSKKMSTTTLLPEEKDNSDTSHLSESEEEPELYFTDPQQLLGIFAELEEQNLSLIQNSQETEEALEEIRQTIASTEEKMEKETKDLKDNIEQLKAMIAHEEEKAADLEFKSRVFAFGQHKSDDQEKTLLSITCKVEEVYRACVGENQANLDALQMLAVIEHQLEKLLDKIEMIPQQRIEVAEKAKEKERRLKLREEKIKQQKLHQEERLRKALERAQADPKKTTGKKLMPRSEPPVLKHKVNKDQDKLDREKEEALIFFG
ncbi:cilia- and flagella-associated protein 100 [Bombina bombina]|uniref:cilia- and flagella-associated protein 100 n=1 Tax=Bombina bombina TaxID=8345 RepID=UPI00235AECFD|nr:cilia- and flagella-associated protein 100 [Bombina bombina]XP_053544951.1 cilia- and flagella-associated protein 100 [Bombina bombina]